MDKPKYSLHLFAGGGGGILADLLVGVFPVWRDQRRPRIEECGNGQVPQQAAAAFEVQFCLLEGILKNITRRN